MRFSLDSQLVWARAAAAGDINNCLKSSIGEQIVGSCSAISADTFAKAGGNSRSIALENEGQSGAVRR